MVRWILVSAAAALAAQTAAPEPAYPGIAPEVLRLSRIKMRARENLTQLPNYTCTETIERSRRGAKARRFQLIDTLRLEVALVGGKEMFAWPGAGRFEEKELRDMVGGTIGNGSFALHARSIFLTNVPTFEYEGEVEEFGRKLHRYRYHVPVNRSGYSLRVGTVTGVAGYHGTFDADAATLDLMRLDVIAHDIPPNLPMSAARDEMRYQRVVIGERDFLLPQSSELTLTGLDGEDSRNRTSFSACRQYSGESTISFGDPPPQSDAPAPPPTVAVDLPEGLLFDARLSATLRLIGIAVGDPLELEVTSNAKMDGRTIIPKGARARGRVVSYSKRYDRIEMHALMLQVDEIEFPGAKAEVHAVPAEVRFPPPGNTGVDKTGIIYMRGSRHVVMKGSQIVWRIEPKPGKETGKNRDSF